MSRGSSKQVSKVELAKELAELQDNSDLFAIPSELQSELEEGGFVWRFVNARKYAENYGQHRSGWRVYKRDLSKLKKGQGALDFVHGCDPEGYVRRLDMVLAVKSKEEGDKHRRKKQLLTALQTDVTEMQANAMEETIKKSGINAKVSKGYDSN